MNTARAASMDTSMESNIYTLLGQVLKYPTEDIRPGVDACLDILSENQYPKEALEELKKFRKDLDNVPLETLKELYSYVFELVSDTTLDLGYYIYEGFKRSAKLLTIKTMYREQGFPYEAVAKGELPDNLAVALQYIGFISDDELRKNFTKTFIIQALEKLHRNFQMKKNAYRHLINTIYIILDDNVKEDEDIKKKEAS